MSVLDASGQPKPVRMKTGISDANYVEVTSGDLAEGQPVIVGMAVRHGAPQSAGQSRAASILRKRVLT